MLQFDEDIHRLYQELDDDRAAETDVWGFSDHKKRSISDSTSLFRDLSNKIKLF